VTRVLDFDQAVVQCQNPITIWDLHTAIKNDEAFRSGFEKKNLSDVTKKDKCCLKSGKLYLNFNCFYYWKQ